MSYRNASLIKVPNTVIDRDIADCYGFDVVSSDGQTYTMERRRPWGTMFVGQREFLASLPPLRIAQAETAITVLK